MLVCSIGSNALFIDSGRKSATDSAGMGDMLLPRSQLLGAARTTSGATPKGNCTTGLRYWYSCDYKRKSLK